MSLVVLIVAIPLGLIGSFIGLLFARDPQTRKTLKVILLVSLGLLVLGGGLCALLLSNLNLNNMH